MSEVLSGVNWYKSVVDLEKECKPRVNSPLLLNEAALSKASECCPHYYDKAPFSSVYTLESVLQMYAFSIKIISKAKTKCVRFQTKTCYCGRGIKMNSLPYSLPSFFANSIPVGVIRLLYQELYPHFALARKRTRSLKDVSDKP